MDPGSAAHSALFADAQALLDLANRDPRAAIEAATALVTVSSGGGAEGKAAAAVALRARGLARVKVDEVDAAVSDLAMAVELARATGDTTVLGEVRMSEAGVLAFAGDTPGALAAITESATLLDGPPLARVLVQRSTIAYRAGDLDSGLADLEQAAPVLEAVHDEIWLAHLYSNRGILLGSRGDALSAERDLAHARDLFARNGQVSAAAQAVWNLGWVAGVAGDVPMALRYYDEAESQFAEQGRGLGELWRDRAETLMSVHLTGEAKELAGRAADALRQAGHGAPYAETLVQLAKAALLDGDHALGLEAATEAVAEMERQRRPAWAALARHVALQARVGLGEIDAADLAEVEAICDELRHAGLVRESVHARMLLLRLAAESGNPEMAEAAAAEAFTARRSGPVDLRVDAWLGLAAYRQAQGNTQGSVAAARAGLRVIDEYQAGLGGSEMRVAVAGHARSLAAIGLGHAYRSRRPERIFSWMERTRAGSLRFAPVRPPDDAALAEELAQLRRIERDGGLDPLAGTNVEQQRMRLQEAIRRRWLAVSGDGSRSDDVVDLGAVVDRLGGANLFEIGVFEGRYQGVAIDGDGARYRPLASVDQVAAALDGLRFGLSRLAQRRGSVDSRRAAADVVAAAAGELEQLLIAPMGIPAGAVVMVPPADLHAVPWALLPSLHGLAVTVAPSARLWLRRLPAPQHRRRGVVVAHGPQVPGAAVETRSVAALHRRVTRLTARESRVDAVMAALNGARLAHLVAHGSFRTDNPLFSSLRMSDGGLTVYDLERVDHLPPVMVLSACNSGIQAVRPGNETMGIVAALLAAGCRTVVASTGLVPDSARTSRTMVELHRLLALGRPPAAALAQAQAEATGPGGEGPAAAPFVCFGAGGGP